MRKIRILRTLERSTYNRTFFHNFHGQNVGMRLWGYMFPIKKIIYEKHAVSGEKGLRENRKRFYTFSPMGFFFKDFSIFLDSYKSIRSTIYLRAYIFTIFTMYSQTTKSRNMLLFSSQINRHCGDNISSWSRRNISRTMRRRHRLIHILQERQNEKNIINAKFPE